MINTQIFSENLNALMSDRGLAMRDLSDRTGRSYAVVQGWQQGSTPSTIEDVINICEAIEYHDVVRLFKVPLGMDAYDINMLYDDVMKISETKYMLGKKKEVVMARFCFFYLCRKIFGTRYALKVMAQKTNRSDHSTAVHGIKTFSDLLETDYSAAVDLLTKYKGLRPSIAKKYL